MRVKIKSVLSSGVEIISIKPDAIRFNGRSVFISETEVAYFNSTCSQENFDLIEDCFLGYITDDVFIGKVVRPLALVGGCKT